MASQLNSGGENPAPFLPDESVDVLHRVTDELGNNERHYWISGYKVYNPVVVRLDEKTGKKKEYKAKFPGKVAEKLSQSSRWVGLKREGQAKVVPIQINRVRRHQSDAVTFEKVYGSISMNAVVLAGIEMASEEEDLSLGMNQESEREDKMVEIE